MQSPETRSIPTNLALTIRVLADLTETAVGGFCGVTSISLVMMCPWSSSTSPSVTRRRSIDGSGSPSSVIMFCSPPICFVMSTVCVTQTQPFGSSWRSIGRGTSGAVTGGVVTAPPRFFLSALPDFTATPRWISVGESIGSTGTGLAVQLTWSKWSPWSP